MDLRDKKSYQRNHHFYQSFFNALNGLIEIIKTERNFRFHLLATLIVILCGFYFKISNFEWISLLIVITLVLVTEIINTALEQLVDRVVGKKFDLIAKNVKDMAAGMVVCTAILALIVGGIIFIPHLMLI